MRCAHAGGRRVPLAGRVWAPALPHARWGAGLRRAEGEWQCPEDGPVHGRAARHEPAGGPYDADEQKITWGFLTDAAAAGGRRNIVQVARPRLTWGTQPYSGGVVWCADELDAGSLKRILQGQ